LLFVVKLKTVKVLSKYDVIEQNLSMHQILFLHSMRAFE